MYEEAVVFDIEANGLLNTVDRLHCIVLRTPDNIYKRYNARTSFSEALEILERAKCIVGHNIQSYDIPAIQKIYPSWNPNGVVRDTLIMSRLQRVHDMAKHSLEAWGKKLGEYKSDYNGGWEEWSIEMEDYCEQDVRVNYEIWKDLLSEAYPERAIQLEHDFAKILDWQMRMGVHFDEEKACMLANGLTEDEERLRTSITKGFPAWETVFIPKVNNKRYGYIKGDPYIKKTPFNVGSRDQVVKYLKQKYGWTPADFTKTGKPKINGEILSKLPYKEAPILADYFDVKKLRGQLLTGENAWLKKVENGKIYGYINHNGAVTGRCTHSKPNLGQVPSVDGFKGVECRELFYAPKGYRIVGCDASGLELRNLAHYMASYDGGAYARIVEEGDVHTENQNAAGLATRPDAKRFIYAHNYGAGDAKLGSIIKPTANEAERKMLGRQARQKFMTKIPALQHLITEVKRIGNSRGYLIGLDGRKLWLRSDHKALNTLLQGAGAVIMKQATVNLWNMVKEEGINAYPILHIHDEMQSVVEDVDDNVERFKELSVESIRMTTEQYEYKCKLDGEAKSGKTWAETH